MCVRQGRVVVGVVVGVGILASAISGMATWSSNVRDE